jgi:hypothetical protein
MKIEISYTKFFKNRFWIFYWKPFKYVNGVSFRILGLNVKIMETYAQKKLIEIFHASGRVNSSLNSL